MAHSVPVRSLLADLPVLEHDDEVRLGEVRDAVRHQHAGLAAEEAVVADHLLEDVLA